MDSEITQLRHEVQTGFTQIRGDISNVKSEISERLTRAEERMDRHEEEDRKHYERTVQHAVLLERIAAAVENLKTTPPIIPEDVKGLIRIANNFEGWLKFNKFIGVLFLAFLPLAGWAIWKGWFDR